MRNTLDSIARRNDRRQREMLRLAPLKLAPLNTAPTQRAVLAMQHARKSAARACLFARIGRPEYF